MLDLLTRQLKESILAPATSLFKDTHPTSITVVAGILGIAASVTAAVDWCWLTLLLWCANRFFDGLDGVVARKYGKCTDFGGYLDIVLDFTVYGLIPVGLVIPRPSYTNFLCLSLLLVTYFVNAAGLFYLSALLEKRGAGAATTGELTALTMPTALIEGTETVVAYSLFNVFPDHVALLFSLFAIGVTITIIQRVIWASQHLTKQHQPKAYNNAKNK